MKKSTSPKTTRDKAPKTPDRQHTGEFERDAAPTTKSAHPDKLETTDSDQTPSGGDSQTIYLREMGNVPLLNRQQEVALAGDLETARNQCQAILQSLGFVARAYLETARRLLRGEERFDHMVADQDREIYLRKLPGLCHRLQKEIDAKTSRYSKKRRKSHRGRTANNLPRDKSKLGSAIHGLSFKATVDFSPLVQTKLLQLKSLVRRHRQCGNPAKRRQLAVAIGNFEKEAWVTAKELCECARQLAHWQSKAKAARDAMTAANLRLVVSVAKTYVNRGVPLPDLIQEGNLGLMKAVDKFDHRRGHKFSTYAMWWIRQSVTRAIGDQGRLIRIPIHMNGTLGKLLNAQRRLSQEYGRDLSAEELAEELQMDERRVHAMLAMMQHPLSIDTPVGEGGDSSVGDFIEDRSSRNPADTASLVLLRENLQQMLSLLDPREKTVLVRRFGLVNGTPETLHDIGRDLKVTRERVRQIEAKALRKMRHPSRLQLLVGPHQERTQAAA
jgi:RNA polymerase primary sigma factor